MMITLITLLAVIAVTGGLDMIFRTQISGGAIPFCRSADLTGEAAWQGAGGSMAGNLFLTNRGETACKLTGWPHVLPADGTGRSLPVEVREFKPDEPKKDVIIGPGGNVSVPVVWSNWCRPAPPEINLNLSLPNDAAELVAPVRNHGGEGSIPRCDDSVGPSVFSVGGFEPVEGVE